MHCSWTQIKATPDKNTKKLHVLQKPKAASTSSAEKVPLQTANKNLLKSEKFIHHNPTILLEPLKQEYQQNNYILMDRLYKTSVQM